MDNHYQGKIQFFTIQFQLNLSAINSLDKKDAEYQYKLTNNNQEVYYIFPSDNENEYRTINIWEYWKANGSKSALVKPKIDDVMSTKPILIQFITKNKNDDYENDFEISFRIKYPNKIPPLEFEPLINDGKIIPNTSYALFPKKDGKQSDSTLYVILNLQKSFNISLYPLYRGSVIDEKDPADLTDPKYYEIYFKNQNQEYILYRSEIRDKKYRWSPFNFRYLNLANPQIFIRFFYHGQNPETPKIAPSVAEYIDFSCKSNSYKDFFKYKTKSMPIDQYLKKCCNDQNEKYYFIFPFIKKSPLNIQKVQAIGKIRAKSRHLFIEHNSNNKTSYGIFFDLSKMFMEKIGFDEIEPDLNNVTDDDNIYGNLTNTIESMVKNISKCCSRASYKNLITDSEYNSYLENLKDIKKKNQNLIKKKDKMPISNNPGIQIQKNKSRAKSPNMHNASRGKSSARPSIRPKRANSASKTKISQASLEYQVLFVYDYESDSEFNKQKIEDALKKLLNFFPAKEDDGEDLNDEEDIFSIAGKQLKNINKGIYNLGKIYNHIEKDNDEKSQNQQKKRKEIELYSGFPLIIVTLIQKSNTNNKFTFWKNICNQYSFIKLICIKENSKNQYDDKIVLKYLAELKCIYDIFVKWTSQINFTFPVQMKIDPTLYNSISLTPKMIYEQKFVFIRRRLLELLSFDYHDWLNLKGHFSVFNYYSWKNPALIMALRDDRFNPKTDIISKKLGGLPDKNTNKGLTDYKQQTYATILAAATSILYHHRGGDPYAEPCFIFALNWIKIQGFVDSQNSLISEISLEDIILNVNQGIQEPPSETNKKKIIKKKHRSFM